MNADALAYLLDKGFTLAEAVELARLAERKKDPTNAERQARHRERKRNGVTVTRDPPIDRTHTPSSVVSPDGEKQNDSARSKLEAFPKPDWCPDPLWLDWLKIRKDKRCSNTATAYRAFLADIAKHSSDEWPPGRLLEYAVARSWASIHPPEDEHRNGRHPRQASIPQPASTRGTRPTRCLDMLRVANAAIDSARDPETDLGDWSTLPAIGTG